MKDKKKYKKNRFFDMEIEMEEGMGNPYRIDNFIPILFLHYLQYKFLEEKK